MPKILHGPSRGAEDVEGVKGEEPGVRDLAEGGELRHNLYEEALLGL